MTSTLDPQHVQRAFGRAARSYDANAVLQAEVGVRLQEQLDNLPQPPDVVLDVGAGTGRGTAALRKRWRRAQVVALDLALPMLQQARRHGSWLRPLPCVNGDAAALPIRNDQVDLLYSNLCLQWCPQPGLIFDEFRRVMRGEAMLLFSTFGPQTLIELREAFAEVDGSPHVMGFFDMHDLGDALIGAGYREPVLQRDLFTMSYENPLALMRELRAIGATNAHRERARGLLGRRRLDAMDAAYPRNAEGRIEATFEVIYARAFAPPAGQPQRAPEGGEVASFSVDQLRGSRRGRS